jgi:molybdopterin-containing oxidoreductase family iron-sulfur binding subunit
VQRIEAAKIDQRRIARGKSAETGKTDDALTLNNEELRVPGDRVKTACQLACPADAIVFGNLWDTGSRVSQLRGNKDVVGEGGAAGSPRAYQMLRYLGIRPRTSYLARVKNPNPSLLASSAIEQRKVGQASAHIH